MARSDNQDAELAALLAASGVRRERGGGARVARGGRGGTRGFVPDAWLDLIAPPDATELRAHLRRLKADLAAAERPEPPVTERLARLRQILAERRVDGLILPLTDEHRSEYLPACAQRLTWLTGFTGSAGLLIVLPERAALFVDGRYTVQATAEVDPACSSATTSSRSLRRSGSASSSQRPAHRLRSAPPHQARGRALSPACAKADAELVPLESNPVDAIWTTPAAAADCAGGLLDERLCGRVRAPPSARLGPS